MKLLHYSNMIEGCKIVFLILITVMLALVITLQCENISLLHQYQKQLNERHQLDEIKYLTK